MATLHLPRRGDVVWHKEKLFFFQPNGSECYLYQYEEEIGAKARAVRHPARWNVRCAEEKIAYFYRRTHLRVPKISKNRLLVPKKKLIDDLPEDH